MSYDDNSLPDYKLIHKGSVRAVYSTREDMAAACQAIREADGLTALRLYTIKLPNGTIKNARYWLGEIDPSASPASVASRANAALDQVLRDAFARRYPSLTVVVSDHNDATVEHPAPNVDVVRIEPANTAPAQLQWLEYVTVDVTAERVRTVVAVAGTSYTFTVGPDGIKLEHGLTSDN